jgi:PAS domain S-box-containing protein
VERILGYRSAEAIALTLDQVLTPDSLEKATRVLEEESAWKGSDLRGFNRSRMLELEARRKDGSGLWAEVTVAFLRDADGNPVELVGVSRDISERKQAEEALKESVERYQTLVDSSLTGIYVRDANRILFANERLRGMSGYSREELLELTFLDLIHPGDRERARKRAELRIAGAETGVYGEYRVVTRSGDVKWVEMFGTTITYNGKPAVLGNVNDITERKRAEEQIQASEEKYRTLFEESRDVVYLGTLEGSFLDINPAGIELFGYSTKEELLRTGLLRELYAQPEDREALQKRIAEQGFVKDYELLLRKKDGKRLTALVTANAVHDSGGNIIAYRGIMRDVTEQKQLEQQVQQAQKMESIGTLAGGIAHDFNNLLCGILGYASLLKANIPSSHACFDYVNTIEKSANRAAELTAQLLGFARGGKYKPRPADLNTVVNETVQIVSRTIDKSIEIKTSLGSSLPTVEMDTGQMQQALLNLCINAADAMPGGGQLTIQTDIATITDSPKRSAEARPGVYVVLSVKDTGVGMDKETMRRIFEPFFTTKEKGKGTGLGLSMVYGIVDNHGGFIDAHSEPGAGSTFRVYLPASGKPEIKDPPKVETPCGGSQTILVVDDEEVVRSLAKDTLENHGYKVLVAQDGMEAIATYTNCGGAIDLVILDMAMPRLAGRETFMKLREVDPNVKALLCTGYSQSGKAQEILDIGATGFVQKPYQLDELLSQVKAALQARI